MKSEYELLRFKKGEKAPIERTPLVAGKTMQTTFRDVLYFQRNGNEPCSLKYNTMTNYKVSPQEFDLYRKQHIGFCKGIIWFYEKETRLQVELLGKARETVTNYPDADFRVALKIPDKVLNRTKVDFGPEVEDTLQATEGLPAVRAFLTKTSAVQLSEYHGTLSMKLCDKCSNRCLNNQCQDRKQK